MQGYVENELCPKVGDGLIGRWPEWPPSRWAAEAQNPLKPAPKRSFYLSKNTVNLSIFSVNIIICIVFRPRLNSREGLPFARRILPHPEKTR